MNYAASSGTTSCNQLVCRERLLEEVVASFVRAGLSCPGHRRPPRKIPAVGGALHIDVAVHIEHKVIYTLLLANTHDTITASSKWLRKVLAAGGALHIDVAVHIEQKVNLLGRLTVTRHKKLECQHVCVDPAAGCATRWRRVLHIEL